MDYTFKTTATVPVYLLKAECGVRYWEDATVNGVEDEDGSLIPCREGDAWKVLIDLDEGRIFGWPEGTEAKIHYKVCDDGEYALIDADGKEWGERDGYVPSMLSPGGDGYGDYVIMNVNGEGIIDNFSADLSYFEDDE